MWIIIHMTWHDRQFRNEDVGVHKACSLSANAPPFSCYRSLATLKSLDCRFLWTGSLENVRRCQTAISIWTEVLTSGIMMKGGMIASMPCLLLGNLWIALYGPSFTALLKRTGSSWVVVLQLGDSTRHHGFHPCASNAPSSHSMCAPWNLFWHVVCLCCSSSVLFHWIL